MKPFSVRTLLKLSMLAVLSGTAALAQPATSTEPPPEKGSEIINHPLVGTATKSGEVPVIDVKNSARGLRYAIAEGADVDESGQRIWVRGVTELERRPLSVTSPSGVKAMAAKADAAPLKSPVSRPAPVIGETLAEAIDAAFEKLNIGGPLTVQVRLADPGFEPLTRVQQRWIGLGLVETTDELRAARASLLEERRQTIRAAQEEVARDVVDLGGSVTGFCTNLPCLNIELPADRVEAFARNASVSRLDLSVPLKEAGSVNGTVVAAGTQIQQFINAGMDGEWGSDVTVAIIDSGFDDDHPGFRDWSGNSPWRIRGRYKCGNFSCLGLTQFNSTHPEHGNAVAGLLIGDLRDGQDANYNTSWSRTARSGYAGEARAYLYQANTVSGMQVALDHTIDRFVKPSLVNMSILNTDGDPQCLGETATSQAVNDVFESGILPIIAAGNTGHDDDTDCLVNDPGAAIGAFTVGGHGSGTTPALAEFDVRLGGIYASSSRGGTEGEGKGRTIIDATAPAYRQLLFAENQGYDSVGGGGTSYAAPTLAAGAVDFIDFYKRTFSDFIDDPGVLATHLLLMTDRQGESGRLTEEFDPLWGGGRVKFRKFDTEGMDSPWRFRNGMLCVDHDEEVVLPIKDGYALRQEVDDFRAVIWWYDRRHENGTAIDDIDLRLETTDGEWLSDSSSWGDNKERVYHHDVGGERLQLRISGWNVTSDIAGCGRNSMMVYYAYYYEDDARDDANGPGHEIEIELH